jgi:long-chain-fatty-acid--CoA ligase ACSBG
MRMREGEGSPRLHLPRYEHLWVSYSGIVTGIYTTSSPEACQYIAHDCRANVIVVDTQKQLEKILKVWRTQGQPRKDISHLPKSPPHPSQHPAPPHTHTLSKAGQQLPTHSTDQEINPRKLKGPGHPRKR